MMSGARNGASALSKFKWQWRREPSLTTQLLNDVPPEIELSDYRRLPSPGSDSPSGFLNGEGLTAEPIVDLDLFFERLYNYHCEKGLWCIVIKWIFEILTVAFVVCFIGFFLLVVDWNVLRNAKCGIEAVESGEKPCNLVEVIKKHPLVPFTFSKGVILGSMIILTIYGLFNFLMFFVQLKNTVKIRQFYYTNLNVTAREIQTTPWPAILEKVVQLQKSRQLCVVRDLSAHEMVMRIMRKENYLIGMINKGVLAFPISPWVPGAGPSVNPRANGRKNYLLLPKTLEWTLNWCIFQSMFDSKFCVQRDFLMNPSLLKMRLTVVGIGMFIVSPCLMIFMLVYLFLKHAEQFYNHPSIAFSRRWSNLSKWIFREFNEVDHLFKHRINNSVVHASNYLNQFPSPLVSIVAKFISFVSGGFAAILIIIAFLDESLLEGHIFGRNLFWYAAIFGTVTAISRAAVTDELQVLDPEGAMSLVVQQTHYMPKRWRGKENNYSVRREFETLFQYTGMMLLEEMASILITPYLLIFVLPERVDDILHFISDFTVEIEGVGHVCRLSLDIFIIKHHLSIRSNFIPPFFCCSLSVFDFEKHGNRKYGSPFDATRDRRSSQGKMEKSFLSFQSSYPTWEPNDHGRQFLSTLGHFGERQMHQDKRQGYSPVRESLYAPDFMGQGDLIHRFSSRNLGMRAAGDEVGFPWSLNPAWRTHPYLLDWYYTSLSEQAPDDLEASPSSHNEMVIEPSRNLWATHNKTEGEIGEEEDWDIPLSDRLQSQFEASTSNPFLREHPIQHHSPELHAVNQWWARPGPTASALQTSFAEPPSFGYHTFGHRRIEGSYRNLDDVPDENEEEQPKATSSSINWRNPATLSKTMYMDDSVKDEGFHLPFMDDSRGGERSDLSTSETFSRPLVNLPVRIIPRSNDPVESKFL